VWERFAVTRMRLSVASGDGFQSVTFLRSTKARRSIVHDYGSLDHLSDAKVATAVKLEAPSSLEDIMVADKAARAFVVVALLIVVVTLTIGSTMLLLHLSTLR
jgi:hypothetical protein